MSSIQTTKRQFVNAYTLLSQLKFKSEYASAVQARNLKKLKPFIEDYNDQALMNQLEHALEKDGVLIKDSNGNYQYSKEQEKALIDSNKKLNGESLTICPHVLPDVEEVRKLSIGTKGVLSIFLKEEKELSDEEFDKKYSEIKEETQA